MPGPLTSIQKIKNWYQNKHRNVKGDKENPEYVRTWNLRAVTRHIKKAEIEVKARELSGANPGAPEYLAKYQQALSKVVDELSDEERAEYLELQDEWNKQGPPEEIKAE